MQDNCLIRSIRLRDFLSFGSESEEVTLRSLNVLIGPNASGKSNLIEAISLLQAAPNDLTEPLRGGGGVSEWLWKGDTKNPNAEIEVVVSFAQGVKPLRHRLCFTSVAQRLEIVDEVIENEQPVREGEEGVYFSYRYQGGNPAAFFRTERIGQVGTSSGRSQRALHREDLSPEQSILSQLRDPDQYPEITYLGKQYASLKLYREWDVGRNTPPRRPQPADLRADFLEENAANLALVLNSLEQSNHTKQPILAHLKKFHEFAEGYTTWVQGGTVQLQLQEKGLHGAVPATRLSDGMLRYLCLLAVLCHPSPPPLICIEEPELGLHPDILPTVAKLLIEASARTQVIVTTHSDRLVSAFSESPESILVCERGDRGTEIRRLESDRLQKWLQKYSLGELWQMGELGGVRW